MKYRIIILLFLALFLPASSVTVGGKTVTSDLSPLDFGLESATTGVERYNVLLKTHTQALSRGVNVNYSGIKEIALEIPENAERIPLTQDNDFQGCVFVVTNKQKTVYLFDAPEKPNPIPALKSEIDAGDFRQHPEVAQGLFLLLIEDGNPWVDNRQGYSYGHTRKDILLLKDGVAQNKVIMPYDNEVSAPVCSYVKADSLPFVVRNLTIKRTEESTAITNVMFVAGKNDVLLTNVTLHTPENDWRNDRAIRIDNCTNVRFEKVTIDGTYSQTGHSGYGISFDNIWNFTADHLVGYGKWGVFGTNNVSTVFIENSAINRFDIHCYGRDVSFLRVAFTDKYNQLNSVFGKVVFDQCTFTRFDPIRIGSSYNAYVPFDVYFNDCVFNAGKENNVLLRLGKNDAVINVRKELRSKCWPNIYIKNLTVNMDDSTKEFNFVYTAIGGRTAVSKVDYISRIMVDSLQINSANDNIRLSITPKPVGTFNEVVCTFKNVTINNRPVEENKDVRVRSNIPLRNGRIDYKVREESKVEQ